MSTSNRSASSTPQHTLQQVKRNLKRTQEYATFFRDQITGLSKSMNQHKRKDWWTSPYCHPNYIISALMHNADRVVDAIEEIDLIIRTPKMKAADSARQHRAIKKVITVVNPSHKNLHKRTDKNGRLTE